MRFIKEIKKRNKKAPHTTSTQKAAALQRRAKIQKAQPLLRAPSATTRFETRPGANNSAGRLCASARARNLRR